MPTLISAESPMKAELFEILKAKSFQFGDFVLASGKRSSYYVDCRMSTLDGRGAYLIGHLLYGMLPKAPVDAVGGMTLGADPIVSSLLVHSANLGRPLQGFLVRKEPKGHGAGRQVEGNIEPWMRIVLVEDVVTTGGSTLKAIQAIRWSFPTIQIEKIIAIIDRESGGREAFNQLGIPFESLYSVQSFLKE